jgi:predicted nucleotidyltransferase
MLSKPAHPEIVNQYRQALLTHFPQQVQRLILFGSQARGDATPESDIDVLVVVNWDEEPLPGGRYAAPFGDPRWRRMVELAYDLSLEYGVALSPIVISEKRFSRWSPLTSRIRREGIELWTKN